MAQPYYNESDMYSQATKATPVVPSDNADIDPGKGLYVGTGGDISMIGSTGTTPRTWKNVQSGSFLPFVPKRVMATGTTATDILALY